MKTIVVNSVGLKTNRSRRTLCHRHHRELRGQLHELRRSAHTTHGHILGLDVVGIQTGLADGNIDSLVSQGAQRPQKRLILRVAQESSLVHEEQKLGEDLLLRQVHQESANQLVTQLVIVANLLARKQVNLITNRHFLDTVKRILSNGGHLFGIPAVLG